jgi:hypothetical protein
MNIPTNFFLMFLISNYLNFGLQIYKPKLVVEMLK